MNYSILVDLLFKRLTRYKLKAFIMMLGIIISVLATVLVQAAGETVKETFLAFIQKTYASNSVLLVAGSGPMGGGAGRTKLRLEDVQTLVNSVSGITTWDPAIGAGMRDVKNQSNHVQVSVTGFSHNAPDVRGRSVQEGAFFSEDDIRRNARVALLGFKTANALFGDESPIGQTLFIDNLAFEVKGILDAEGVDPHGGDRDKEIQIPYSTLMQQMMKVDYISSVTFIVDDQDRVDAIKAEIIDVMRQQHQLSEGQEDDFSVITPDLMKQMVNKTFNVFDIFLPVTSGIAFFISAIVILNVMLINIKERTPEIGLRKALGARPNDLKLQFLSEIVLITLIGAVIGLLLALVTLHFVSPIFKASFGATDLSPSAGMITFSLICAIIVGVAAGYIPAKRAAKLHPVEALK